MNVPTQYSTNDQLIEIIQSDGMIELGKFSLFGMFNNITTYMIIRL